MISIICPTYNRASLLAACVAPILELPHGMAELLLVDDASTDETAQVCSDLMRIHGADRILYIRLDSNSGAQVARNRGIAEARGNYLMFVDSDDVLVANGAVALLELLQARAELSFVYGKVIQSDENLQPLHRQPVGSQYSDASTELAGYHWHTMGAMYRRNCIDRVGPWNVLLTGSQDWEYQARVKICGGKGEFVDTLVGYWRQHEGSRVGAKAFRPDYVKSVMLACDAILTLAKMEGRCDCFLERRIAKKLITHALEWGSNGYRTERTMCLLQASNSLSSSLLLKTLIATLNISPVYLDGFLLKILTGRHYSSSRKSRTLRTQKMPQNI